MNNTNNIIYYNNIKTLKIMKRVQKLEYVNDRILLSKLILFSALNIKISLCHGREKVTGSSDRKTRLIKQTGIFLCRQIDNIFRHLYFHVGKVIGMVLGHKFVSTTRCVLKVVLRAIAALRAFDR